MEKQGLHLHQDSFDSRKYLGEQHAQTSFAELQQEARSLRSLLRGQEIQLKAFVRDNFGRFISCKDSIDAIYEEIKDNDMSHHAVQRLADSYTDLQTRSDRVFGSLLDRRAEIEEKRNVLAALKRYRTIFNLPLTIQSHLEQKEYEKAMREYKKAISYLAGTNVRIFMKVSEQIHALGQVLRERLLSSLGDASLSLSQHSYHIGLLQDLGGEGVDPAWHYLFQVQGRILAALDDAYHPSSTASATDQDLKGKEQLPTIRRLCSVLLDGLPDLVQMARAHPSAQPQSDEGSKKLVIECLVLFTRKVRTLFGMSEPVADDPTPASREAELRQPLNMQDEELNNIRECIVEMAKTERSLVAILNKISISTEVITALVSQLSLLFTSSVCRHTLTRAALLWTKGTNDYLEPLDEVGKDWGTHVHLAKSLDKLLHSALLHYQSVPSLESMVKYVEWLTFETVQAFADSLHATFWPKDPNETNPDILLVVALENIAYLRVGLSHFIASLRSAPPPSKSHALTAVLDHLKEVETLFASEYLRCRAARVYASLGSALVDQLAVPFSVLPEVREYIAEAVVSVVTAQAELASVDPQVRSFITNGLVERIISCYEESICLSLPPSRTQPLDVACFHQLHSDVIFLQAAFAERLSPAASASLSRVQQAFLPRLTPSEEAQVREVVNSGMAHMSLILQALN